MLSRLWCSLLKHFALSGPDGHLSFSKSVVLLVLFTHPPALLGVACVAGSFGIKAFLEFLKSGQAPKADGQ